jgi:translation initiation factor IF-2
LASSGDPHPIPSFGHLGRNGPGLAASWGRPTPTRGAAAQAGFARSWADLSPGTTNDKSTADGSSEQINHQATTMKSLLPHEQRARDLMLEKNKAQTTREVNIRGHGPEASRAGRPWPMSEADRLALARSAVGKKRAQEVDLQRKRSTNESILNGHRTSFRKRHVLDDGGPKQSLQVPEKEGETPQWSQLRRRQEIPAQEPPDLSTDRFAEGRAQREEWAKSGRYTPLSNRFMPLQSVNDTGFLNLTSNPVEVGGSPKQDQPKINVPQQDDEKRARREWARDLHNQGKEWQKVPIPRFKISSHPSEGPPSRLKKYADHKARSSRMQGRGVEPRLQVQEQEDKTVWEKPGLEIKSREELAQQQKRQPSRFAAAKPTQEAAPKGRQKDKARRRQQFLGQDEEGANFARDEASKKTEVRKQRKANKAAKKAAATIPILLPEYISVSNLAMALKVRFEDFVERLEELGYEETSHDYILNAEDAGLIAMEYNYEAIIERSESEDLKAREPSQDLSTLRPRPPVVTIMGHVDHGKTTLLDWLRKSSVAATEHGGITQHIGAFSVPMPSGKIITFLDTPGHAAFLSMRQRGANVTDIVILVVAADDSVKPQTIEAINHAKAANVPIIVAINKIDKEEANIDRVKQDLARHGVDVEDFGGDTQVVCVSGKTGQGMAELEEAAVTLSEILDMRAEVDGQVEGWVLEASIKSVGKVATVLVRRGTVRPGDFIVAGNTWARIRCLRNEAGVEIEDAGPGMPVEIDGWREQPVAGDEVLQAPDEAKAKSVVAYRLEKLERDKMAEDMEAINSHRKAEQEKREQEKEAALVAAATEGDEDAVSEPQETKLSAAKNVSFIIKGDVSGSVEAVIDSISHIGSKEVQPVVLRAGVGKLSEFDVEHAAAAKGHLINFNTPIEPNISRLAEQNKVNIINHNIIYRLVDDVKAELSKQLPPLITQRVTGEAEIAQTFDITIKKRLQKSIAGCKVRNGTVTKSGKVRVFRKNEKIFDGRSSYVLLPLSPPIFPFRYVPPLTSN